MILPLIDQKIRNAFSNAAVQYDVLASLQREIGRELTKKFIDESFNSVLDIGMGTGWLSNRLQTFFPDAEVVGLDVASGMIEKALQKYGALDVVQADAKHLPFKEQTFDLITSNLAYQWVFNLEKAFEGSFDILKPNGLFCFTMFGFATLEELFQSIDEALESQETEKVQRLATLDEIKEALEKAGFQDVEIKNEIIKTHFPTMFDLVRWLKSIGANMLPKNIYIGKDCLHKANLIYNKKYKDRLGIYATFEVLWIRTKKL